MKKSEELTSKLVEIENEIATFIKNKIGDYDKIELHRDIIVDGMDGENICISAVYKDLTVDVVVFGDVEEHKLFAYPIDIQLAVLTEIEELRFDEA